MLRLSTDLHNMLYSLPASVSQDNISTSRPFVHEYQRSFERDLKEFERAIRRELQTKQELLAARERLLHAEIGQLEECARSASCHSQERVFDLAIAAAAAQLNHVLRETDWINDILALHLPEECSRPPSMESNFCRESITSLDSIKSSRWKTSASLYAPKSKLKSSFWRRRFKGLRQASKSCDDLQGLSNGSLGGYLQESDRAYSSVTLEKHAFAATTATFDNIQQEFSHKNNSLNFPRERRASDCFEMVDGARKASVTFNQPPAAIPDQPHDEKATSSVKRKISLFEELARRNEIYQQALRIKRRSFSRASSLPES